ncbi:MAG TPA: diguanylate cyclase [Acidimicrobiales bacterium]|nr:diguanylate cyclase [Acidimicrobiales bacterium]
MAYAAISVAVLAVASLGPETGSTTFWPGAGLTVAVLLLRPRREWPALLAAVFVAELVVDVAHGFGVGPSLGYAVANCVEPLVGALLVRRFVGPEPDLRKVPDLLRFVAAAVVAGPLLGAVLGSGPPVLLDGDPWLPRLPQWFAGDGVGVLVVASFVLTRRRPGEASWKLQAAVAAGVAAVAFVVAGPWVEPARLGLEYLLIPVLVLVGARLRTGGAAAALLAASVIVETVSAASAGPFAAGGAGGGLVAGQMFLVMGCFTALVVAALTHDLVERERTEASLRAQILHDDLTGLGNRRLLDERLGHALDRLPRESGGVAVISIDLDGFKAVNDRHGHAAGDAVLVEIARRIEGTVRVGDTPARVGGDEFVVLAEHVTDPLEAAALARRLAVALSRPVRWEDRNLLISASVGLAVSGGYEAPTDLLARADQAMYRTKHAGGGATLAFSDLPPA